MSLCRTVQWGEDGGREYLGLEEHILLKEPLLNPYHNEGTAVTQHLHIFLYKCKGARKRKR
jgi:hypothetical protein